MPLNYNGTNIDKIVFNGVELNKVVYNGVVVWEAGKFSWYVRPTVSISNSISITNRTNKTIKVEIIAPQGVSFNANDTTVDGTEQFSISFILQANENKNGIMWYWIGDLTQPTTLSFMFKVFDISGNKIEFFWENYIEETTTTYASLTPTSSEGNFKYYQGGHNK